MGRELLRWFMLAWFWMSLSAQTDEAGGEEEIREELAEYTLIFQTAFKSGAGTDDDVMLKMTGDRMATMYPLRYRGTGRTFNTGRVDRFNITDMAYMGPICSVELWTKSDGNVDLWTLETLSIVDWKTDDKAVFNVSGVINYRPIKYNRIDKADGKWSRWSDWSECVGTCPTGSQSRNRSCSRPPPSCGGGACHGVTNQTQECPVPGCSNQEETTTPAASNVSIIVPIVVAVFVIIIVIAVVVFRRKKRRDEELTKKNEKQDQAVEYDKMHAKGDGTYGGNNYVA